MTAIPPGSTIGILGSGQLGRMLAIAAAQLGYRCHILAPESGPACDVAAAFTEADYDDPQALHRFAEEVAVVTYEFENIDPHAVSHLSGTVPVRPGHLSLAVSGHRAAEKAFVEELGGRPAPWRPVTTGAELAEAVAALGTPAILKTASMGYDGKGQARISHPNQAVAAWESLDGVECVLEGVVAFEHEFSILHVRSADGSTASYPPPHNMHRNGILWRSAVPAPKAVAVQWAEAAALAGRIAERLGHVGVLAVEFFAAADGPVFNEMAPRVHNSGHWTIEGAVCSQFENHIRAICGLPLGSTTLTGSAVEMENLLGEDATAWPTLLANPAAHLHLYGKNDARDGRKMGHVTRVQR